MYQLSSRCQISGECRLLYPFPSILITPCAAAGRCSRQLPAPSTVPRCSAGKPTRVLSVLRLFSAACCPRPESGQSSRSHQPTGQTFRELDLVGTSWELTQIHQIPTEPSFTLALHIHNPKISSMKMVNRDLLEIPCGTKRTSTVIGNSTK